MEGLREVSYRPWPSRSIEIYVRPLSMPCNVIKTIHSSKNPFPAPVLVPRCRDEFDLEAIGHRVDRPHEVRSDDEAPLDWRIG